MPETCATESKSTSLIAPDKSYIAYLPAVALAMAIAVVSLIERPQDLMDIHASDKVLHGLMYALLALCAMVGAVVNRHSRWRDYIAVVAVVTLYGALMEWMQYACTQTRSGEWLDIVADLVGAVLGVVVVGLADWAWRKVTHTTSH